MKQEYETDMYKEVEKQQNVLAGIGLTVIGIVILGLGIAFTIEFRTVLSIQERCSVKGQSFALINMNGHEIPICVDEKTMTYSKLK